ncbi:choline transport protein [Pseudozyma hubeiensis SY62]|uniref:Choline transport protein n=1 Tax=Pseudozyma hubeiensis (strain SY62) TaxID=1305764 RepID=R9NXN8_PSEHS|nr:choline transport protein [Pseudozyma hubeiensis SY62]GAC93394.1 choline transport protein [Pseudozyma hubeiensis SY62]
MGQKQAEVYDYMPKSESASGGLDYPTSHTLEHGQQAEQVVPRKHFSTLALIGLSFAILNSWTAACASINLALGAGGPVGVVWGLLVGTLCATTIALSLAELCHVFPSIGGQYHWAYAMAPKSCRAPVAYFAGWLGTTGWIALASSAPLYAGSSIVGMVTMYRPDFIPSPWKIFCIYMAITIYCGIVNIWGAVILNKMNQAALLWSITGAIVVFVVCLAVPSSQGHMSSASFIFTDFVNLTGWPDAIAWGIGLISAQYCLVGCDGASHVIDEIDRPHINAPKAMILSCLIGGFSAFLVLIAVLAGINDMESVIQAGAAGIVEAILQATRNKAATLVLNLIFFGTIAFAGPALMITASRMVQAYANDGCLPFKNKLAYVSPKLEVPVYAVLFCCFWYTVFGLILFGSVIAVQAIVSASVVLLQLSYIVPIAGMLFRGRRRIFSPSENDDDDDEITIPTDIKYTLGPVFGPLVNTAALCYIAVTTVLFLMPSYIPVTSGSLMNYSVVVVGTTTLLATINWFVFARKTYTGPKDFREVLERAHLRRAE